MVKKMGLKRVDGVAENKEIKASERAAERNVDLKGLEKCG